MSSDVTTASARNYWLLKSEPDPHIVKGVDLAYAAERFLTEKDNIGRYTGVRNLQARGNLRDRMKPGDLCFFYHSSCKEPGIAAIVEVVTSAIPDDDALDPAHPLYDEKHSKDAPRWFCCDVKLVRMLPKYLPLSILRAHSHLLGDMTLLRQPRLSVQPVKESEWNTILQIEQSLGDSVSTMPSEAFALPSNKPHEGITPKAARTKATEHTTPTEGKTTKKSSATARRASSTAAVTEPQTSHSGSKRRRAKEERGEGKGEVRIE